LLSDENTHFEYRNDFVEIAVLCLIFSYLVYNVASAPGADDLKGDRPKMAVPRNCSRSSGLQNIGVSKAFGSDALIIG